MPIQSRLVMYFRSEILVPVDRLREETDSNHANNLAKLIEQQDLIHPIVIDRDTGQLIAGAHRVAAWDILAYLEKPCRQKAYENWMRIPARLAYDVTEQELLALELSENIGSKKMSWKEIARGVARIHFLANTDSDQTRAETAALLNMTPQLIGNNLRAAFYLTEGEALVIEANSLTGAMNVIQRLEERQFDALKEELRNGIIPQDTDSSQAKKEHNPLEPIDDWDIDLDTGLSQPSTTSASSVPQDFKAIQADFIQWAADYSGPRFNFVHCDLPYGINYDKSGFDYAKQHSIYGDSKDLYFSLLAALCDNTARLVTESAHLIFWYDARYKNETVSMLERAGWKVWPHHLIWFKSDNAGVLADPKRGPRHVHETAIFASRGDRMLVKPVADTFATATTRTSGHVSEKPVAMLQHFFQLAVDSSTYVLDPTAGSFNSILAAKRAGAKGGVGIELDIGYATSGTRRIREENDFEPIA